MKKKIAFWLTGTILYLLFLIILTPVSVILSLVPLPKEIKINQVQGTLWQGEAHDIKGLGQSIAMVEWQFTITHFKPALSFKIVADQQIQAQGSVFLEQPIKITNLVVEADVNALHTRIKQFIQDNQAKFAKSAPAIKQFNELPLTLSGQMLLNVEALSAKFATCHALDGQLKFEELNVDAFGINIDLDNVSTPIRCQNNQLLMDIRQTSEVLTTDLSVKLDIKTGQYDLNGHVQPTDKLPSTLGILLNRLPGEKTQRQITLQGKL